MSHMNEDTITERIYARDHPDEPPYGWIQWKGTDVCIDLHCACGCLSHHDGTFFYAFRCPACKQAYAVGQVVKLIALTEAELEVWSPAIVKEPRAGYDGHWPEDEH